ncbi:MAG TPA: alkane 1-monooxygenase [Myxococcota bacterium]|jgi:alkane 1-monooxygenase|nr:alkane 1-monooxygenase [Myxococcota bacterium]
MTETSPFPERSAAAAPARMSAVEVLRVWAPHLAALLLPLLALGFLLTAPHPWWLALLIVVPPGIAIQLADRFSGEQLHEPRPDLPAWPFDGLLFLLVAIQLLSIALLARVFAAESFWSVDALVAILVVGASSGYSGIVVAHELIHRQSRGMQLLGRLLLCTVMYEHFYTEHVRGHHLRVGTPEDPATAHFGESFHRFYLRTVPAQFRSAWRLEAKRLGDEEMSIWDRRQLRNRVLHGVVAEWSLAFAILASCGAASFALFLLQALFASRALEVVNYFEHWGLVRTSRRVRPVDSWDTHSRFTYYALTGLTRHADHHAYAARPYQQLRVHPEPPVLPRGYIALFPLVLGRNATFRRLMTEELRRKRLGPFAEPEALDLPSPSQGVA